MKRSDFKEIKDEHFVFCEELIEKGGRCHGYCFDFDYCPFPSKNSVNNKSCFANGYTKESNSSHKDPVLVASAKEFLKFREEENRRNKKAFWRKRRKKNGCRTWGTVTVKIDARPAIEEIEKIRKEIEDHPLLKMYLAHGYDAKLKKEKEVLEKEIKPKFKGADELSKWGGLIGEKVLCRDKRGKEFIGTLTGVFLDYSGYRKLCVDYIHYFNLDQCKLVLSEEK